MRGLLAMTELYHTPVLAAEVMEYLLTSRDGVYVDGTIGGGGHAGRILDHLLPAGVLIGFDVDADAIRECARRFATSTSRVVLIHDNFRTMAENLRSRGFSQVDGILLDLGLSSYQIDGEGKGFSFQRDEMLDMRMDIRQTIDAASLVNTMDEKELEKVIKNYGEDYKARRIARAIVRERTMTAIRSTNQLAKIVRSVVRGPYSTKSLARVFQALRIAVNRELDSLKEILTVGLEFLSPGGRLVVISYHSLEDRIVKEFFRSESAETVPSGNRLLPDIPRIPRMQVLTKKPIRPAPAEIAENSRARSAKLRAGKKV